VQVAELLVSQFEIIFCSTPRALFDEIFFFAQQFLQKRVHTIWCPHGNSDKGARIFHMEGLQQEQAALVYGKQQIDFLQEKWAWNQIKCHVILGNFRYAFFKQHEAFYIDKAREKILRKLPKAQRTFLYAPTWKDHERSCSLFDAISPLVETLPQEHNLIIKLH